MKLDLTLYLVTDRGQMSEEEFLRRICGACAGGVTLVQLREKELGGREYFNLAVKVKKITDNYDIPLLIDDRADVAAAIDAAGVHVGQEDIPVWAARKLLGNGKIIGATAKTLDTAKKAADEGADYIGTGAIYPTSTKVKTVLTSVETLDSIARSVNIPVCAIGGLNAENCGILRGVPIAGIAAVSAIMKNPDSEAAARKLKDMIISLREKIK